MINEILKKFDEKYGYEYPRCALIMKNIEVRDENEELIGHTSTAAVTPEEIKSFISSHLTELLQSLIVDLEGEKRKGHYEECDIKEVDPEICGWCIGWRNTFNEGLNLAQERIRGKLK